MATVPHRSLRFAWGRMPDGYADTGPCGRTGESREMTAAARYNSLDKFDHFVCCKPINRAEVTEFRPGRAVG